MKFSIIIPAYNVADYLENCVESILKQTYDNYEVIIVMMVQQMRQVK